MDTLIASAAGGGDRATRLAAVFRLGTLLAGAGREGASAGAGAEGGAGSDAVARSLAPRAIAALERLRDDGEYGAHWLRKRAKRAIRKIRGEAGGDADAGEAGDGDASGAEATQTP